MKLIIQIPCFNEEGTLKQTLDDLPKKINGIDTIEVLIIDDGSSDNTVDEAKKNKVKHIVSHKKNLGLASAFMTGIKYALKNQADIIINTDADNQYSGKDIEKLVKPILSNQADIVIGARPIKNHLEFSILKKFLQLLGSFVVRVISNTSVEDAPSGFRAYSRNAAKKINVFSRYSYTLETIIQAGYSNLTLISVPISVNRKTRESRLFKNMFQYIFRSLSSMLRAFAVYKPFGFFGLMGVLFFLIGFIPFLRFLYYYFFNPSGEYIQSILFGSVFLIIGFILIIFSFIADLISVNRRLVEKVLEEVNVINEKD
jgi:glycosyltransferase involved in cell wall biosynthesis